MKLSNDIIKHERESGEMCTVPGLRSECRLDRRDGSRLAVRSVIRQCTFAANKATRGRRMLTRFMAAAMSGCRIFMMNAPILMGFRLTSLKFPESSDTTVRVHIYQRL